MVYEAELLYFTVVGLELIWKDYQQYISLVLLDGFEYAILYLS